MKLASHHPKFTDLSNLAEGPSDQKNSPYLIRRKSTVDLGSKKRPPSSQPQDQSRVCFIPMSKIERNPDETACQNDTCNRVRKNSRETENDCSFDSSLPRFSRNSQKSFKKVSHEKQYTKDSYDVKECLSDDCRKQKHQMNLKIDRLMAINQHLTRQTQRLTGLISKINTKFVELSGDLQQKTLKIEQLSKYSQNREMSYQQLQDMLAGKDRLILRLQESIRAIEKQKSPMSCKVSSVDNGESAEIIHELNQKLKYKQIESYLLKKERQAHQELEKQHKAVVKQNTVLKERLNYYLRKAEKQERNCCLKESVSSLSLSMTSACSERFSFGLFDPSHLVNGEMIELTHRDESEIRGSNF